MESCFIKDNLSKGGDQVFQKTTIIQVKATTNNTDEDEMEQLKSWEEHLQEELNRTNRPTRAWSDIEQQCQRYYRSRCRHCNDITKWEGWWNRQSAFRSL